MGDFWEKFRDPTAIENESEQPLKLFIDCDAGTDDAVALMMALSNLTCHTKPEILGISSTFGNTNQGQVQKNIARVLRAMGTNMHIFAGAERPLIADLPKTNYHGADGLNEPDLPAYFDPNDPEFPLNIASEHAANAIVRITSTRPGEVTLVCLGPLTNLALAVRLDPTLPSRVKALVVMGGAVNGIGNVTPTGEFNFVCDPEAAHIVLSSFNNITLVPWELCEDSYLEWEQFDQLLKGNSDQCRFLGAIFSKSCLGGRRHHTVPQYPGAILADAVAMAVAVAPSIVTESHQKFASVELYSPNNRGQCVIDWRELLQVSPNVHIVTKVDKEQYQSILAEVFSQSVPLQS